MTGKQATPYLFFDGDGAEAIKLYEKALGAKVEGLMTYAQMPEGEGFCEPADRNRVMHALLQIDRGQVMVSDRTSKQESSGRSNVHVVLDFSDPAEMARRFDALASSGTVHMAIHDAFWGDKFGALQDKYGVHWMFTCALGERPAS